MLLAILISALSSLAQIKYSPPFAPLTDVFTTLSEIIMLSIVNLDLDSITPPYMAP